MLSTLVYCSNCFNKSQNSIILHGLLCVFEVGSNYNQSVHTCNVPLAPAEGELLWAVGGEERGGTGVRKHLMGSFPNLVQV